MKKENINSAWLHSNILRSQTYYMFLSLFNHYWVEWYYILEIRVTRFILTNISWSILFYRQQKVKHHLLLCSQQRVAALAKLTLRRRIWKRQRHLRLLSTNYRHQNKTTTTTTSTKYQLLSSHTNWKTVITTNEALLCQSLPQWDPLLLF